MVTVYRWPSGVIRQEEQQFRIWIHSPYWLIRTEPAGKPSPQQAILYREVGTDGSNVFTLQVFNPAFDPAIFEQEKLRLIDLALHDASSMPASEMDRLRRERETIAQRTGRKRKQARSLNQAVGDVRPGLFPWFWPGDQSALLWLAYCSGPHVQAVSDALLPRLWGSQHPMQMLTNRIVNARVVSMGSPPYLPERVYFVSDGSDFEPPGGDVIRQTLPAMTRGRYTNAVYRVGMRLTTNGMVFPGTFTLEEFGPDVESTNRQDLRLLARLEGKTTRITWPGDRASFIPVLPVATSIEDQRFCDSGVKTGAVRYIAGPGAWPATNNVAAHIDHERGIIEQIRVRTSRKRLLFRGVVLVTAIGGLYGVWRSGRNRRAAG